MHGIDREITAVLGEGLGFETDGAAINIIIHGDDITGICEQRIWVEIGHDITGGEFGGGLRDVHITMDALHGGVDYTLCMLGGLALDFVARLHKEDAQRQHKDGDGHQQDAEAELPGKRLADMSDYIAHL